MQPIGLLKQTEEIKRYKLLITSFSAAIPSDPPMAYKMPSKMATPSPRRGVCMGHTSTHMDDEGLIFVTDFIVWRPERKGHL